MNSPRTTDCANRIARSTVLSGLLAAFASLLVPVTAVGADLQLGLELLPAALHMPQRTPTLQVSLTWPDSCLPTLERLSIVHDSIDITLRAFATPCTPAPTPYRVVVDPARAAGNARLEARAYRVRVYAGSAIQPTELVAFGLLDASGMLGRTTPENGFWWSVPTDSASTEVLRGSGISLERQDDRIAVTLLGYESGQPTWYFGSAQMSGAVARVPLMRMSGGSEPFAASGAAPEAHGGPVLNLAFTTPAHASAWLERAAMNADTAIELQEIALTHVPFGDGPSGSGWRGTWILVEHDSGSARLLDLSQVLARDADTFRLSNPAERLALDCRNERSAAMAYPAVCTLSEDTLQIAAFDRIGLDSMNGVAPNGARVRLLRLRD